MGSHLSTDPLIVEFSVTTDLSTRPGGVGRTGGSKTAGVSQTCRASHTYSVPQTSQGSHTYGVSQTSGGVEVAGIRVGISALAGHLGRSLVRRRSALVFVLVLTAVIASSCSKPAPEEAARWHEAGIRFSRDAGKFIEQSHQLVGIIEDAYRNRTFSELTDSPTAVRDSLSDTIVRMRSAAPEVHPDLVGLADEIVRLSSDWLDAAWSALVAGSLPDPAAFARHVERMRGLRSRLDAAFRRWNSAIEAA